MSDRIYFGLPADVALVREAFDIAMRMPVAPTSGPHMVSAEVEAQMRAAWWALSAEQRDSESFDHLWPGWSLRWSNVYSEPAPGLRIYSWVTDGIDALISSAQADGLPLTLQHVTALLAAKAAATPTLPANWTEEL
jgi:hypothetical protein